MKYSMHYEFFKPIQVLQFVVVALSFENEEDCLICYIKCLDSLFISEHSLRTVSFEGKKITVDLYYPCITLLHHVLQLELCCN